MDGVGVRRETKSWHVLRFDGWMSFCGSNASGASQPLDLYSGVGLLWPVGERPFQWVPSVVTQLTVGLQGLKTRVSDPKTRSF